MDRTDKNKAIKEWLSYIIPILKSLEGETDEDKLLHGFQKCWGKMSSLDIEEFDIETYLQRKKYKVIPGKSLAVIREHLNKFQFLR